MPSLACAGESVDKFLGGRRAQFRGTGFIVHFYDVRSKQSASNESSIDIDVTKFRTGTPLDALRFSCDLPSSPRPHVFCIRTTAGLQFFDDCTEEEAQNDL